MLAPDVMPLDKESRVSDFHDQADITARQDSSDVRSPETNSEVLSELATIPTDRQFNNTNGSQIIVDNGVEMVFPTISSSDYDSDDEFRNMYQYLRYETLTGRARLDKTILITAERYFIEDDGLLYRIEIHKQKKLAKLKPIVKRLCVPRRFRHDIIAFFHD